MLVLLNPKAAGGTSIVKMSRIESTLRAVVPTSGVGQSWKIYVMDGEAATRATIAEALGNGEMHFVAAGGDGTVNILLNHLMTLERDRERICVGAIGLGSSNDFHKPFNVQQIIEGVSCKVDFTRARLRDVGVVSYKEDGGFATKYFLVNASVGAAAQANMFFNSPDNMLAQLKKINTPAAILYAGLRIVGRFRNIDVELSCRERGSISTCLTNLGIVKSPHFSGDFCYPHTADYQDGRFIVHLCHNMRRGELLHLLWALTHRTFTTVRKTESWSTASLMVTSSELFAVELDGEVVTTTVAQFNILPRHLKVCP